MQQKLESLINDEHNGKQIQLNGNIKLNIEQSGIFTIGKICVKGIIHIKRSDIIIDGSNANIEVNINDSTSSDWSLFFVHPTSRNVTFRNLNIKIQINNKTDSTRSFSVIYNTAYGMKINNCNFEVITYKQLNLIGIYNNGNLDTHMETRADNFVVSESFIKLECRAEEYNKECNIYGIYNNLANSITVQNTFIYSTNKGNGELQKAVGVFTNGRFGRFVGNNIKANGTHNIGKEKEQAYAVGFINDGLYSIITANNIIGEWAGKSVGLENNGGYTIISSNKILATHTICGRSIINGADNCEINGNILTSTSRNAILLEHTGGKCYIGNNIMEVLMTLDECRSGCGIKAYGDMCNNNIICENIILNVSDCGIFTDKSVGSVFNNQIFAYPKTVPYGSPDNKYLLTQLDENNIRSIKE